MTILYSILPAWLLAFLLVSPGWAWQRAAGTTFVVRVSRALGLGLVLQLPCWLLLAEYGMLSIFAVTLIGLALALAGGLVFRGKPLNVIAWVKTVGVIGVMLSFMMILPPPGEWIVGGWDPGVIMNQGMWIGRTGTLHPPADMLSPILAADTVGLITRQLSGLREAFPGIPVNPADGSWSFSFYRGTPLWVSFLYVLGGAELAVRSSLILALMTLWMIAIVIARVVPGRHRIAMALLAVLIQPVFVYHMRTPGFEMLQLLLVMTAVMCLDVRPRWLRYAAMLATGFCLLLNHVSFILFGLLLALGMTLMERRGDGQRKGFAGIWLAVGIWLGWGYVACFSPMSLAKVGHVIPMMLKAAYGLSALVALLTFAGRGVRKWDAALFPAALVMGIAFECWRMDSFQEFINNLSALAAMNGYAVLAVGLVGSWAVYIYRPGWRGLVGLLALCLFIVLTRKHTVDLYPWALKRFLPFAVPLLALGMVFLSACIGKKKRSRWVFAVLVAMVSIENARMLYGAARHMEFGGLSAGLKTVAAEIPDDAILIADHFKWGTPLAAVHGKHVVNGEPVWTSRSAERVQEAIAHIKAHAPPGTPLYWLVVTDVGLGLYPGLKNEDAELVMAFDPIPLTQMFHHHRYRGFSPAKPTHVQFTLYRDVDVSGVEEKH